MILGIKKLVLFVSGSGTNMEKIFEYFKDIEVVSIELLICNNKKAYALTKARELNIRSLLINKENFYNSSFVSNEILKIGPSLIVLAGFLWKIPKTFVEKFSNKIINIHPALLPKYGGKGMYGINIHNAVIEKKEVKSGITIHYVNENYDEGEILFQKSININKGETAKELSKRILALEHEYYPKIIHKTLKGE